MSPPSFTLPRVAVGGVVLGSHARTLAHDPTETGARRRDAIELSEEVDARA